MGENSSFLKIEEMQCATKEAKTKLYIVIGRQDNNTSFQSFSKNLKYDSRTKLRTFPLFINVGNTLELNYD
jgi:hypothetical protein